MPSPQKNFTSTLKIERGVSTSPSPNLIDPKGFNGHSRYKNLKYLKNVGTYFNIKVFKESTTDFYFIKRFVLIKLSLKIQNYQNFILNK